MVPRKYGTEYTIDKGPMEIFVTLWKMQFLYCTTFHTSILIFVVLITIFQLVNSLAFFECCLCQSLSSFSYLVKNYFLNEIKYFYSSICLRKVGECAGQNAWIKTTQMKILFVQLQATIRRKRIVILKI